MTAHRRVRGLLGAVLFALFAVGSAVAVPASAPAATRSLTVTLQPRQAVVPGGTARFSFLIKTTGKVGPISFAFRGSPAGASTTVSQVSSSQYELAVSVPTITPSGLYAVSVRTVSRAPSKSFTVYLDVVGSVAPPPVTTPPPPPPAPSSFGIRADNPEVAVVTGQTAAFGFTVDRSGGYTGDVTFSATGLPTGVTANFAPNPTRGGTFLYATPSASTPNGRYTVTIKATSDPLNARFTSVILSVTSTPDFALVVPASANLPIGGTVSAQVGYRLVGSTAPIVSLGVTGLPPGVSFAFTPNPTFGDSTLTLTATSGVTAGSYPISVTGVAGAVTRTYPMTVNISGPIGGFGLSASPSSLTIARGASSAYAVTITPTGGFASAITFVVSGLPAGVTIAAGGTAPNINLNVSVPLGAIPGTYPLTLTGTSGTLAASIGLSLIVT